MRCAQAEKDEHDTFCGKNYLLNRNTDVSLVYQVPVYL